MDANHPAWKLAAAAHATWLGDADALENAIAELKPSSKTIAQAYALCLTNGLPFSPEAARLMLKARLQVAVMEEHVAAQERMGQTINVLTGVLVVLTLLLVVFGFADIADKWSWSWCPWR